MLPSYCVSGKDNRLKIQLILGQKFAFKKYQCGNWIVFLDQESRNRT